MKDNKKYYKKINEHIKNYINYDNSKTAILLTGEWGSGKSHYVSTSLCPFLKDNKIRSVVVSLYGICSLSDISKRVYLNLRFPTFSKKSEIKETLSIVGGSVLDNILSINGVKIDISQNKIEKLYESVNLKDVFLIFEDFERSSIDILMLLGYINGLVEYDGAKVLIVANENELIKQKNDLLKEKQATDNKMAASENVEMTDGEKYILNYQRIKEKTIGDTIHFQADIACSVKDILGDYKGLNKKPVLKEDEIQEIGKIVSNICKRNLRIMIYAYQKYDYIFSQIDTNKIYSDEFYQATFEGLIILAYKVISSGNTLWAGSRHMSTSLGTPTSPVFRFVYDYVLWDSFDEKDVDAAAKEYEQYKYFDQNSSKSNDADLDVLRAFHLHKEVEVYEALDHIKEKLKDRNYIGIQKYEKYASLIMLAGSIIGYDTDEIIKMMLENAKIMCKKKSPSYEDIVWGIYGNFDDAELKKKYEMFLDELANVINRRRDMSNFTYDPNDLDNLYNDIVKNRDRYIINYRFISCFDVKRLLTMLESSTAEQISSFRDILLSMYRGAVSGSFDENDRETMGALVNSLEIKLNESNKWDKIQMMQVKYLILNLRDYMRNIW